MHTLAGYPHPEPVISSAVDTAALPPFSRRPLVLATDLDGTFLGGDAAARRTLYDLVEANRRGVGLIFVTGRDPDFIEALCADGSVPWPEYVVGDVGTTIARIETGTDGSRRVVPVEALERDIVARWNDGGARARAALDGHPGLALQPTDFRHRVSYDLDAERFDDSAHRLVAALDLDSLVSDDRYFDVLPRGVSKGPSLRRLLAHLDVSPERTLAAGDTLNDLSMLVCGTRAVAVGGSEAALLAALDGHGAAGAAVHRAEGVGAAGITEAMVRWGLHPPGRDDHPRPGERA